MIDEKLTRIDTEFGDIAQAVRDNYMSEYKNLIVLDFDVAKEYVTVNDDGSFNVDNTSSSNKYPAIKNIELEAGDYTILFAKGSTLTETLFIQRNNDNAYNFYLNSSTLYKQFTFEENGVVKFEMNLSSERKASGIKVMLLKGAYTFDNQPEYQLPRKYKPSQIPQGITDMANDIKDTLYNYLPTKKVIDGVCENAVALASKEVEIDGNSEQETTEGYNLFNYKDKNSVDKLYVIDNDGWITITCDNSKGTDIKYFNYFTHNLDLKTSTQYNVITEIKKITGDGQLLPVSLFQSNGQSTTSINYNFTSLSNNSVKSSIFTTSDEFTSNQEGIRTFVRFLPGQIGSITFRLSVLEDITVTPQTFVYEPYTGGQPSPNPDYPQNIEVVDMVNLIDIEEFNGSGFIVNQKEVNIESGNYLFSFNTEINEGQMQVIFFDDNKIEFKRLTISMQNNRKYEFSLDQKASYISIYANKSSIYKEFMLTKGTTQKPYLPYGCIGLEQSGKNKINLNNGTITLKNGGNVIIYNQNINIKGTITAGANKTICNIDYELKKDKIYTLVVYGNGSINESVQSDCCILIGNSEKSNYISVDLINGIKLKNYTPTKDIKLSVLNLYNTVNLTSIDMNVKVMLLEGEYTSDTIGEYEPYHSPKLYPTNLNGNTLAKVGDIADKLKISRSGKIELEKNINKIVLDGNEDWIENPTYKGIFMLTKPDIIQKYNNAYVQSNNFFGVSNNNFSSNISIIDNSITNYGNTRLFIAFRKYQNNLSGFKTWLSQNKPEIYYALATSQTIALPSIEPIKLFEGTNIFKLITNIDTDYTIEYVVDKNSILNDVQSALLEAEPEEI